MTTVKTYTEFGPDIPLSELPPDFSACLPPNPSSPDCDSTVGSLQSGLGYCSCDCDSGGDTPPSASACPPGTCDGKSYAHMTYCACVNNAASCPQLSSAPCANSAFAYQPWGWSNTKKGDSTYDEECATTPICVNIVEVGGDQNVVNDLTQQCGTFETVQIIIGTNPALAALALFLVLVILGLLLARTDRPESRLPPPPPPGLSAYFAAHPGPR